ncbi:hypothetical protein Tco_1547167 [Tanacetum coccineum]
MPMEESWEEDLVREKVIVCDSHPDQPVVIKGKLSIGCKQKLVEILRRNVDVFAWIPVVGTTVPRFIMEHQLKTYPLAEPKVQKRRCLNPNQRRVLKEKVFEWVKAGTIRRVQYLGSVTNAIPINRKDGTWQVHTDLSSLNKVCPKDMYPFLEVEEKLESIIGYQYKCFLKPPKEGNQIRMSKEDREKRLYTPREECFVTLTCERN